MNNQVQQVAILGGGSAGFLAALAVRRLLPELNVTLVHSPKIPVISVGESTTGLLPQFIHERLGLDRKEFFARVLPTWKMGIRFHWGAPEDSHFNYSFEFLMEQEGPPLRKKASYYCMEDWYDAGPFSAAMDRNLSPCLRSPDGNHFVVPGAGYHIENKRFIAYLSSKAEQLGVTLISTELAGVTRDESGHVQSLQLANGQNLAADLFIDCSGFRSLLLNQTVGEKFHSYNDAIFCDHAVVGNWQRDDVVLPYTTVDTMNSGWCWRIDFLDDVSRGYVFSSQFCDPEDAIQEMREKNPLLGDDLRLIPFKTGRYENFWSGNVVGIGNASGFVEPLEATALHMIAEQLQIVCGTLRDSGFRLIPEVTKINNLYFREKWDDIRDFLALHYKFNRRLDTPFWRHCQEKTSLGNAQALVDFFADAGPTTACNHFIPRSSMFGYNGYMVLLIEQRVPTEFRSQFSAEDLAAWEDYRNRVRSQVSRSIPVRQAMELVHSPNWNWPARGV
jgi:tryptophan halogenase